MDSLDMGIKIALYREVLTAQVANKSSQLLMYNNFVLFYVFFCVCLIFAKVALVQSCFQMDFLNMHFKLEWIQTLEGTQVTICTRFLMEISDVLPEISFGVRGMNTRRAPVISDLFVDALNV